MKNNINTMEFGSDLVQPCEAKQPKRSGDFMDFNPPNMQKVIVKWSDFTIRVYSNENLVLFFKDKKPIKELINEELIEKYIAGFFSHTNIHIQHEVVNE